MTNPFPAVTPVYEIGSGTVMAYPAGATLVRMGEVSPEAFFNLLDDLITEDILSMTGDELRAEILAEGGDPEVVLAECRAGLERAIRECEATRAAELSVVPA